MAEGSKQKYVSTSVTAGVTELAYNFPQAVKRVILRNSSSTNILVSLVTDSVTPADATVEPYSITVTSTEPFEDELAVKTVRYKTSSGTSTLYIYGSW